MKGGNFAKKYVVKLIQERWFLNFTFHKGTCIVRRASRLHFYRVFLAVRSNFHWSVRQEFIPLMTHFLILMVIISLDVHGRQLIFLRSPLLFFSIWGTNISVISSSRVMSGCVIVLGYYFLLRL